MGLSDTFAVINDLGVMVLIAWLVGTLVVYGLYLHDAGPSANRLVSIRRSLIASALLAPGGIVGAHFALPMPPGLAVLLSLAAGNYDLLPANVVSVVLVAAGFWVLDKHAPIKAPVDA